MTDTLTGLGSAEAGNPDGGNGEAAKGSDASSAATENRSAEAGNLDWAKAKGWLNEEGALDTGKLAEGYQNLEKRIGTIKAVPDDKATPEQVDEFHRSQGWPGKPEGYEFKLPEGLPENLPYDEGFANTFKQWASDLRLSAKQAQGLHDSWVKQFATDAAAYEQETAAAKVTADKALADSAKAAHEVIVKDWGEAGSESYLKNRDAAVRAARTDPKLAGIEADLKAKGLLTQEGNFTSPAIAHLLAEHGKRMQNDTLIGNGAGGQGGGNPFAKDTFNITEQALLIRSDPAKARALAAAAGMSADRMQAIFGS